MDGLAQRLNERFEGRGLVFDRYDPLCAEAVERAPFAHVATRRRCCTALERTQCLAVEVETYGKKMPPRVISAISTSGNASILAVPRSSRSPHDIYSLITGGNDYELVHQDPFG